MLKTAKEFLQQVFRDFSQHECPSMAAALAYATLFALPLPVADCDFHSRTCSWSKGCER
jgi:hypothetical protein